MNQDRSEAPLHAVVGATGAVGGAVVDELVRRGHRVRSVARHEMTMDPSVEQRLADVMDASQATEAIAGASVVYHCAAPAYTRWVDEFPQLQANVADAAERAGARLVVLENLYMYGPTDGPMRETTPMAATGKKGSLRARLSQDLLRRHADSRLRVAIGRASDYYGPRAEFRRRRAVLRGSRPRQGPALARAAGPAAQPLVPPGHRGRARHPWRASGGRWRGLAPPGQPGADRR